MKQETKTKENCINRTEIKLMTSDIKGNLRINNNRIDLNMVLATKKKNNHPN